MDRTGDVTIDEGSSIWFNCVLRGDTNSISVGRNSNIQAGLERAPEATVRLPSLLDRGRQAFRSAAEAIRPMTLTDMDDPPIRIALGSDALQAIEAADEERLSETDRWRSLSRAIDF